MENTWMKAQQLESFPDHTVQTQLQSPHLYINTACCRNLIGSCPTTQHSHNLSLFVCVFFFFFFFSPNQLLSAFPNWRAFPQGLLTPNTLSLIDSYSSFPLSLSLLLLLICYIDRWSRQPTKARRLTRLGYFCFHFQSIQ